MFPFQTISRADERSAASDLGVPIEVIKAVAAVEARRSGFIKGTDLPCILFEGHKFSRFTSGVHDRRHPHLSYPKWTKAHYKGGRGEYDRLIEAIQINGGDPEPALKATSWGMFQIMGFNHAHAGYDTVTEFVNDFALGEDRQMKAFVSYIEATGLADELRGEKWAEFARKYNGPGYRANQYDVKLANEFTKARMRLDEERSNGVLDLARSEAAELQTALNVAINAGLVVDGWIGKNTRAAIRKLQVREAIEETGDVDAELCALLGLDISDYENVTVA